MDSHKLCIILTTHTMGILPNETCTIFSFGQKRCSGAVKILQSSNIAPVHRWKMSKLIDHYSSFVAKWQWQNFKGYLLYGMVSMVR